MLSGMQRCQEARTRDQIRINEQAELEQSETFYILLQTDRVLYSDT